MPTPIRQLLSQTSYDADGTTTVWNFSFSGGYLDKSHVKASYRSSVDGDVTQIPVTLGMFLGPFQLNITPAIPVGNLLTIYRDTPKDLPLVDFTDDAAFTEVSLDTNAKQAIFASAECVDTINTQLVDANVQIALDAADAAEVSRLAAGVSETNAAASAVLAGSYATSALGSANAAAASAASIAGGPVTSVAGLNGIVNASPLKVNLALDLVNNTSDVNKPVSTAQATADEVVRNNSPAGQVRISVSGGNILLSRYNGSMLWINGKNETVPNAGVTLLPTAVVAATLYYIYAFMSAGVMTLERVTTVPVTDTTFGIRVKTGDATRTLVGMAIAQTGGTWTDIPSYRGVISWFNQRPIECVIPLGGNISTASVTSVELDSSYRIAGLAWVGNPVAAGHSGSASNSSIATVGVNISRISGSLGTGAFDGGVQYTAAGADYVGDITSIAPPVRATSDGLFLLGIFGGTAGGTLTVKGSAIAGGRCTLFATTLG